VTEHQEVLKELGECVIETWLRSFTMDNASENIVQMHAKECFDLFIGWCKENKVEYNINAIKFGVRLTNLKINGVSSGDRTSTGVKRIFDISKLKKHFNISD